jgi:hypothetical protein
MIGAWRIKIGLFVIGIAAIVMTLRSLYEYINAHLYWYFIWR